MSASLRSDLLTGDAYLLVNGVDRVKIDGNGKLTLLAGPLTTDQGGTGDVGGAWASTTPVPSGSGTPYTSANATVYYKKIGRTVFFSLDARIITAGGATTGAMVLNMPYAAARDTSFTGREGAISGKVCGGVMAAGSFTMQIFYYDNTTINATGARPLISGCYETTS